MFRKNQWLAGAVLLTVGVGFWSFIKRQPHELVPAAEVVAEPAETASDSPRGRHRARGLPETQPNTLAPLPESDAAAQMPQARWARPRQAGAPFPADPKAALEAILRMDDPAQRTSALLALAAQWMRQDPATAVRALTSQVPPGDQAQVLGQVAAIWSETDPKAAIAWLSANVSDAEVLSLATDRVYATWARKQPQQAASDLLGRNIPAGSPLLGVVLSAWAEGDLPGATDWFRNSLAPAQQDQLRATLLILAGMKDPAAARTMLRELPVTENQWDTLRRTALTLASANPELAAEVGSLLPPQGGRDELLAELQRRRTAVSAVPDPGRAVAPPSVSEVNGQFPKSAAESARQ